MAGIRRLQRVRRKTWHCDVKDKALVHLYFFPYAGFPAHCLYDPCFLDEYSKIHLAT